MRKPHKPFPTVIEGVIIAEREREERERERGERERQTERERGEIEREKREREREKRGIAPLRRQRGILVIKQQEMTHASVNISLMYQRLLSSITP